MVDLKKDQLSLFGRPGRRIRPTLDDEAPQPIVVPVVVELPEVPAAEVQPEAAPDVEAAPEPEAAPDAEATPAVEAAPEAEATPAVEAEPELEATPAVGADPEPAATPTVGAAPEPVQTTTPDGVPGVERPASGKPQEQYLFPPKERARLDWPFSRRMSDLVRRLQLMERDAKGHLDLTLPQSHAIHALMEAGSLRMQELAGTLGLAQSTVTRLVAPLKRMGLLDRRPDRNDGRATRAFLTPRGTAVVDLLERADRELYEEVLGRLPDTRRAEVVAAIELLHEGTLDLLHERALQHALEQANS